LVSNKLSLDRLGRPDDVEGSLVIRVSGFSGGREPLK
jgi:hypothetical protein